MWSFFLLLSWGSETAHVKKLLKQLSSGSYRDPTSGCSNHITIIIAITITSGSMFWPSYSQEYAHILKRNKLRWYTVNENGHLNLHFIKGETQLTSHLNCFVWICHISSKVLSHLHTNKTLNTICLLAPWLLNEAMQWRCLINTNAGLLGEPN